LFVLCRWAIRVSTHANARWDEFDRPIAWAGVACLIAVCVVAGLFVVGDWPTQLSGVLYPEATTVRQLTGHR
jgi:hypothetical protein